MSILSRMVKTMKIKDETHARLSKHGNIGDTFDDVVTKLLDHYEKTLRKK